MYLEIFLADFAVFHVFLGISRVFAEIPEFRGSATAQNIRSPVSVFLLRTQVRPSWIWKVENAIHWIKLYPNDCRIGFPNTCPLDSDLSSENCYPTFEKLEPVGYVSKYWHWCFSLRVLGAWSTIYIYIFFFSIGQLRSSISRNLNVTHHWKDLRFLPLSKY